MAAPIADFAGLIRPVGNEAFFADIHDRKPLHVPADGPDKFADIMTWQILTDCLNMTAIWSDASLEIVLDTAPVPPEQYCRRAIDRNGQPRWQPDAERVKRLMRRGASLVANDIDTLRPGLAAAADALESALGAKTQCNLYCSWAQHPAFDVHYDTHEVFVLHAEGEKRWRVYKNRVDRPIAHAAFKTVPQATHDQQKGELLLDVVLHPGDLLYIPRGFYHEALAASAGTVHVSFGLTHVIGLDLLSILLDHAVADPLFRSNFPMPRAGEPATHAHARALAARLSELAASENVIADLLQFRRRFHYPRAGFTLPDDGLDQEYTVTADDLEILDRDGRRILRSAKGAASIPVQQTDLVAWVIARGRFTRSDYEAAFPNVAGEFRDAALRDLAAMKVLKTD